MSEESVQKSYSAWYWKIIPHERVIQDDYVTDNKSTDESAEKSINPKTFEFRDEANRKWYSIFDEYEYRYNKFTRSKQSWWRWFEEGTSLAEKKLLLKLDFLILFYAVLGFWSQQLDSMNISNAYVSGMKEDLNMQGNDLSTAIALASAGGVIFQLPFMYLFPRVPLHYTFSIGNLVWSIITFACSASTKVSQLYACRFFVGAGESGFFMSIHYLLGSWYKPDEISRRGGIFYTGLMLGALTAGLLQGRIFAGLDGVSGRAGWRWMFIIDGAITLPVAIVAFYFVPGTPENCTSLFLNEEEILLSRTRLRKANIKAPSKHAPPFLDKKLWKKVLTSWQIYVMMMFDGLFWNCAGAQKNGGFALWLKSLNKYSTPDLNRLTAIPPAIGVAAVLLVCFSADILRSRSTAICWSVIFSFVGNLILAIWDVSDGAKLFAFYTQYFSYAFSSVLYGWLNDIMRFDPQQRSIVLCAANIFSSQSVAWITRLTFPTESAPKFRKGYTFATVVCVLMLIWIYVTYFFYKRQEKRYARSNGIVLYNTKTGEIPEDVLRFLDADGNIIEDSDEEDIGSSVSAGRVSFEKKTDRVTVRTIS